MKKRMTWLSIGFFVFALLGIFSMPAKAAQSGQSVYTLKPGVTYKNYDVTGDKKADKIVIKRTKGSYSYTGLKILINGKTAYSFSNKDYYEFSVKLYTLKNKKPFLYIYASENDYDGPVCGLFRYSGGKLKQAVNFQTLYKDGCHQYGEVTKVSENTLTIKGFAMSWALGPMTYTYQYKYGNGTLQRTSKTGKITSITTTTGSSWLTARKSINFYKSATATSKSSTIKAGTKVKVTHCYTNGSNIRLKVKTKSGKVGWIKSPKKAPSNGRPYFKECFYAG